MAMKKHNLKTRKAHFKQLKAGLKIGKTRYLDDIMILGL